MSALASGDFDADGIDDLAIGIPYEDLQIAEFTPPPAITDAGAVYVLYGPEANAFASGAAALLAMARLARGRVPRDGHARCPSA